MLDLPPPRLPLVLLLALTALLASPTAHAKDLRGRLGVGFDAVPGGLTSVSVRYGLPMPDPAINVQPGGYFGIDAYQDGDDATLAGGTLLVGIVAEDNMNLYAAGSAGGLMRSGGTTLRVRPSLVAEFFPFGLENLGFSADWGADLDLGQQPGLRTSAALGVHYWF